jgi:hypothetical protein
MYSLFVAQGYHLCCLLHKEREELLIPVRVGPLEVHLLHVLVDGPQVLVVEDKVVGLREELSHCLKDLLQ